MLMLWELYTAVVAQQAGVSVLQTNFFGHVNLKPYFLNVTISSNPLLYLLKLILSD